MGVKLHKIEHYFRIGQRTMKLLIGLTVLGVGSVSTKSLKKKECPENWVQWEENCYFLNDVPLSWSEASEACSLLGSNLASIHSLEEGQQVWWTAGWWQDNFIWIGGNDLEVEGDYQWTDGTTFDYVRWSALDRCGDTCDCLAFGNGYFYDVGCDPGMAGFRERLSVCKMMI